METRHVPPRRQDVSRTLGIDLSSQPRFTTACLIEWRPTGGAVLTLTPAQDDDQLVTLVGDPLITTVAIDAPFGWPSAFADAVAQHDSGGPWPTVDQSALALRVTDKHVWKTTGQRPLSVSTDRIAYTAFRCARLLTRLAALTGETIDRSGTGRYLEVYPAAALRIWSLSYAGYKGKTDPARKIRHGLVTKLFRTASWLTCAPGLKNELRKSDHAFDALISAIVARAAEVEQVLPIPVEHAGVARREGWISIPTAGLLKTPAIG